MDRQNLYVWFSLVAGVVLTGLIGLPGALVAFSGLALAGVEAVANAKAVGPVKEDVQRLIQASQMAAEAHAELVSRVAEVENRAHLRGIL